MAFTSCDTEDPADDHAATKQAVVEQYASLVLAGYEDSHAKAVELQAAIGTLIASPSQSNLDAARLAWLAAREPYGQTEAFRFSGGPIDDADGPEGAINAWPLDEGYIDYVVGAANSGIINDAATYPSITAEVLESLNEQGGETNISIGFHAIEFLLWGQDLSDTGPGNRPFTDFVVGGTAANQDRRAEYLMACANILVQHMSELIAEWQVGGSFRTTWLAMEHDFALSHLMTGIGTLSRSELPGERVFTALDNQDQEDEHSCFSDNTHRDIYLNAKGINNVIYGRYTRVDGTVLSGTSLHDLIAEYNATEATELEAMAVTAMTTVSAIPVPFDQAIQNETTGGNGPVMQVVHALQAQGDKIVEAATAIGLTISTELPG